MTILSEESPPTRHADHADRHARALAALRTAEQDVVRPATSASVTGPPAVPVPGRSVRPSSSRTVSTPTVGRAVHPALAPLLPGGVLPAGGVLTVQGSTSLLLGLLAAPSRDGAWTALVGAPAVGLLAAADAGIALGRTAVVPSPGPDAPAVLAALLDGMDLVVVGPQAALTATDRRRLAARTRRRDAVLVATTYWPGAHVALDARGGSWAGTDSGAGWLRRRTLRVLRTGRGAVARPVEIDVEVPLGAQEPSTPPADGAPADRDATTSSGSTTAPRLRVA
ncbi:hypothetical protein [Isoptericola aurantiacus]|uniref:hypothetical protein n=1 Tax=Isoptericola aurantiacus TaxID=3377839 RepID=UPI00383B2574